MKKILLVVAIGTSLFACKKEKTERKELFGKWQWNYSTKGSNVGDTIKPAANTVVLLTLKSDSTYTASLNGQVSKNGTMQVVTSNDKKVLKLTGYDAVGGLSIQASGTTFTIDNTRLRLAEVSATTPYTHHFTLTAQ